MKWRKYNIPITSEDGSVTFSIDYTLPVYTADEAEAILADAATRTTSSSKLAFNKDDATPTDYGTKLLDEFGLRYATPLCTCPIPHESAGAYNTEWYNAVAQNAFTGITDVTPVFQSLPLSETTSYFGYYDFSTKVKSGTGFGRFSRYIQAANQYMQSTVKLQETSSDVIPVYLNYYGSGTGSNSADVYFFSINIYALIDGDDTSFLQLNLTGYKNYNPSGLNGVFVKNTISSTNSAFSFYFIDNDYEEVDPTDPNNDPYANGGESGTGGGDGTFDWGGDSVGIPDLPAISASDAGFITLFNPSLSQLKSLAAYMWSDLFDVEGWQKIFADPMDAILGLSIVPVAVPDGGTSVVKVGNISTSVSMTKAAQQYIAVDCGTITIAQQYNSYLDYEPFSKAEIYLPFIGMHALSVDDVMGKAVHVVYHVDILSGACVAYVEIGGSVHYTFIGQCSSSIPITGNDWTNVINGVLNIAGSIGSMVATGGASAPLALGSIASTAVNSMKPTVEKSGSLSGTGGLMANKKPYIILTRPRQCVPKNQNKYLGYPSFINEDLGELSGYTEVESIRLTGAYGTEQEMEEIYTLLKSGVIF